MKEAISQLAYDDNKYKKQEGKENEDRSNFAGI